MTPKPMTNIDRALAHLNSAIETYDWFWPGCEDAAKDDLFFAKEELESYQQDQAARQAAMEHKLIEIDQALFPVTEEDGTMRFVAGADIFDLIADALAMLDATEQEAGHE